MASPLHIAARVTSVRERMLRVYNNGIGDAAVFDEEQIGWLLTLDNHAAFVYPTKPEFEPGDQVILTIQHRRDFNAMVPRKLQSEAQQEAKQLPSGESGPPS